MTKDAKEFNPFRANPYSGIACVIVESNLHMQHSAVNVQVQSIIILLLHRV
jgi:hypothetical protein